MNTLNQFQLTVNEKPITKITKDTVKVFECEVTVANGTTHTQFTKNIIEHVNYCNKQGWKIESVIQYVSEKKNELRPNYNND